MAIPIGGYTAPATQTFPVTAGFETVYVTNPTNTPGLAINTPALKSTQYNPNTGAVTISFLNAFTGAAIVGLTAADIGSARTERFILAQTFATLTASTALTVPATATKAIVQSQGGNIWHNTEGITATIAVTQFQTGAGVPFPLETADAIAKFRVIAAAGTTLRVEYYAA